MDKTIIEHCIFDIADHFDIPKPENIPVTKDFLEKIKEKDESWFELIQNLLNSNFRYEFVCQDRELRIKASDIWQEQKDSFKKQLEQYLLLLIDKSKNERISLCKQNDINEFLKS